MERGDKVADVGKLDIDTFVASTNPPLFPRLVLKIF